MLKKPKSQPLGTSHTSRRAFISTTARVGAITAYGVPALLGQTRKGKKDLNVAVVGVGQHGRVLLITATRHVPGVRIKAVFDIWNYSRRSGVGLSKKLGHEARGYADCAEMLKKEEDLDAVIVATPDFTHAPISNACLKSGLDVFCEAPMAHSVEAARSMVLTARESGRLLQIGHQRRSNPRYRHVYENLLGETQFLGRITRATGSWKHDVKERPDWIKKYDIEESTLAKYGYANMHEFRNWRGFRRFCGGLVSELGGHQIDVFNWWLNAAPGSVTAGSGIDFGRVTEQYNNLFAIYEYKTKQGEVRCVYDIGPTTSSGGGHYEHFMGDQGDLRISEMPGRFGAFRKGFVPEGDRAPWEELVGRGWLNPPHSPDHHEDQPPVTRERGHPWTLPGQESKSGLRFHLWQPHLENFFAAVREEVKLNAPAETAFKSTVASLTVNQSIAEGRRIDFKPSDFEA